MNHICYAGGDSGHQHQTDKVQVNGWKNCDALIKRFEGPDKALVRKYEKTSE